MRCTVYVLHLQHSNQLNHDLICLQVCFAILDMCPHLQQLLQLEYHGRKMATLTNLEETSRQLRKIGENIAQASVILAKPQKQCPHIKETKSWVGCS